MRRAAALVFFPFLAACASEEWSRPNTTDRERIDDAYRCEMEARRQVPYFGNDPERAGILPVLQAECMRYRGYRLARKT